VHLVESVEVERVWDRQGFSYMSRKAAATTIPVRILARNPETRSKKKTCSRREIFLSNDVTNQCGPRSPSSYPVNTDGLLVKVKLSL
jgi:hypothetical protein